MRRVLIIPIALLFFVSFAHVNPVQACTGGGGGYYSSLDNLLPGYPTIVVGRVHTLSESTINAVLHIEQIIKGDPINEYILFTGHDLQTIAFLKEARGYPVRCSPYIARLPSGRRFIAGLRKGSDFGDFGNYDGTIITEELNGMFNIFFTSNPEISTFTYDELIAYAAQTLNETPRPPQHEGMPRPAAVRLSSESGKSYVLPVDQNNPFPVEASSGTNCHSYMPPPCLDHITAPNGIDRVSFYSLEPETTQRFYEDTRFHAILDGETGVYSARSDLIAAWADQELRVFATPGQVGLGNTSSGIGPRLLRMFTIEPDDTLIPGAGAWSPDGRTFAFSTESGVWLWDIMPSEPEPRLLLPASDAPILVRHFSPAGNFLAVESDTRRYHVDVNTLVEYPDGVFSPDDRLLAAFDTSATETTTLTLYGLMPEFESLRRSDAVDREISQFEWVGKQSHIYATCGDGNSSSEDPGFHEPWCKVFSTTIGWSPNWVDGVLFDYDPVTRSLVTLIDGDTITFNGEVLEMAGIDSAIVDVELIPVIDLEYTKF